MNDESVLVERGREGDLESFNRLVELYQANVYNLSLRMLGNEAGAADATQETFLSAYRAMRGFRGGNLRSWLLRIAANTCKDMMRASKARPAVSLDDPDSRVGQALRSEVESPDDYVARMELGAEIQRGLDTVPPEQKLAIVLIDIQGFSYEEAANIMKSSLGTVKSRLSRGRQLLKAYLRRRPELLPRSVRLVGEEGHKDEAVQG